MRTSGPVSVSSLCNRVLHRVSVCWSLAHTWKRMWSYCVVEMNEWISSQETTCCDRLSKLSQRCPVLSCDYNGYSHRRCDGLAAFAGFLCHHWLRSEGTDPLSSLTGRRQTVKCVCLCCNASLKAKPSLHRPVWVQSSSVSICYLILIVSHFYSTQTL